MSTSTAITDLTSAETSITDLEAKLKSAATAIGNAEKVMTNKGGKGGKQSLENAAADMTAAETLAASALTGVQSALATINPTPAPTPAPTPTPSTVQPVGIAGDWNLVFDDEFTGTTLDTTKWTPGWWPVNGLSNPVNGAEVAGYSEENITVDNGLNLALAEKSITTPDGKTFPYTGSLISSNPGTNTEGGGFQYTYGVFEAKAYLPANSDGLIANWPGVWATTLANGSTYNEDDIVEGLGGYAAYHYHNDSEGPGETVSSIKPGWHTFASLWDETGFTYYYDGVKVGSIAASASDPMYLIFDNTTSDASTAVDAVMQVAYARVWQAA